MVFNEHLNRPPQGSKEWFAGQKATDTIAARTVTSLMQNTAKRLFTEDVMDRVWSYMFDSSESYNVFRGVTRAAASLINVARTREWGKERFKSI